MSSCLPEAKLDHEPDLNGAREAAADIFASCCSDPRIECSLPLLLPGHWLSALEALELDWEVTSMPMGSSW